MSPFAGYTDFADCVRDNGDKRHPEAFCAWLEHEVTGRWPSESSQTMPTGAWEVYRDAYHKKKCTGATDEESADYAQVELANSGWQHARFGYLKSFEAPKMRTVTGVKVFSVGTWTDSSGVTRDWTQEDMLKMVEAFNANAPEIVSLKAGHTSDAFNSAVAKELEVPVQLITGEIEGNGQVSLGKMASLELKGGLLVASFERVPEVVADLIDSGMYDTVSAEIEDQIGEFGPAITGVALLGAENPAVEVATLDRAMVFGGKREGASVLTFAIDKKEVPINHEQLHVEFRSLKEKMAEAIKGMRGAPIFRAMLSQLDGLFKQLSQGTKDHQAANTNNQYQEDESMEELKAIAAMLGLDEAATAQDIMAAIEALVAKAAEAPAPVEQGSQNTAELAEKVKTLESQNAELLHDKLVGKYAKATGLLTAIEGKPEEMAEELAIIEETHGAESAGKMLSHYQKSNDLNRKAIEVLGTEFRNSEISDEEHPFEAKVKEHAKQKNIAYAIALVEMQQAHPQEFAEFRRATRPAIPEDRP